MRLVDVKSSVVRVRVSDNGVLSLVDSSLHSFRDLYSCFYSLPGLLRSEHHVVFVEIVDSVFPFNLVSLWFKTVFKGRAVFCSEVPAVKVSDSLLVVGSDVARVGDVITGSSVIVDTANQHVQVHVFESSGSVSIGERRSLTRAVDDYLEYCGSGVYRKVVFVSDSSSAVSFFQGLCEVGFSHSLIYNPAKGYRNVLSVSDGFVLDCLNGAGAVSFEWVSSHKAVSGLFSLVNSLADVSAGIFARSRSASDVVSAVSGVLASVGLSYTLSFSSF